MTEWTYPGKDRSDSGAAAVEFALIVPILVLLVMAIVDFGFTFNTHISLTQAAREGVRIEALHFLDDDSATRAEERTRDAFLAALASGDELDIEVTECPDEPEDDDFAKIDALLEGFSTGILRFGPFDLTGEAVMRCGG